MNSLRDRCQNAAFRVLGQSAFYRGNDGHDPSRSVRILDLQNAQKVEWEGRDLNHGQRVIAVKLTDIDTVKRGDVFEIDGLSFEVSGKSEEDYKRAIWVCEVYRVKN